MKGFILSVLIVVCTAADVFGEQAGLTEYQEFKSYPYIEKAYRLQRRGDIQGALVEVQKALEVAPDYFVYKQLKLQLQFALLKFSDVITLFLNAAPEQQSLMAKPILETLLLRSEAVPIDQYALVLNHVPEADKAQSALQVDARLVGQQRLQDSLDLLRNIDSDEPALIQRQFLLASELGQHEMTVILYQRLITPSDEKTVGRYLDALLSLNRHKDALALLKDSVTLPFAATLLENFIQRQIGALNYQLAEQGFVLLTENGLLSADLHRQRLQMQLVASDLTLNIKDVLSSDLPCWQQAEILINRLGDTGRSSAEEVLLTCNVAVDEQQQYATVVLSVLRTEQLMLVVDKVPQAAQTLREGIIARLVATEDFKGILALTTDAMYKPLIPLSSLALAYQKTNDLQNAADSYWQIFQHTNAIDALDQATFLWSALGYNKEVINALEHQLSSATPVISDSLVLRYIDNIGANGTIPEPVVRNLFAHNKGFDGIAEKLRLQQDCKQSVAYIDHFKLLSHANLVTQALCLQQIGDQRSITTWKQVLENSRSLDNFKATMFAMMSAHQYLAVLDLIADYSQFQTDLDVRQTKLQALIQSRDHLGAFIEWQQQFEGLDNKDYLTGMELALQCEEYEYANELANQLISNGVTLNDPEWALVAQIKTLVSEPDQALVAWKMLLEQNPLSEIARLNIAYATIPISSEQALSAFQQYVGIAKKIDPEVWKQMAYLADSGGNNEAAVPEYLDNYFSLGQGDYSVNTQDSWSLHEFYQQSSRRWNFNASSSHGNGAVLGDVFFIDNQGEVDDNLPNNGLSARLSYRMFEDTKRWKAYTQVNVIGSDSKPADQQSLEFGISYRLLENVNVQASGGALYFTGGDARLQPFVRLSGDFLNQDEWRNGWRFEPSWWERQWYNDVLYLIDNKQLFAISRFDGGYVRPLPTDTKQTLKLYGLAQLDYRIQSISATELEAFDQISMGFGVQWRLFETPSSKEESSSVWSASVEFHNRLSGDLTNDDAGFFITLGYQY
jgi:hypothetical protein